MENVSFQSNSQLEQIGDYAFLNCKALNTVLMPSSVTSLGDFIFLNCENSTQYSYNNYMFYIVGSLNCRSNPYSNNLYLDKGYSMYLSFVLECPSRYDFNVSSEDQINILLYDNEMNIIFDQPVSIYDGTNESIIKDLEAGKYFLKIEFVNKLNEGNVDVVLRSRSDNVDELLVNEEANVLMHSHNNHNEFTFMRNTSGFYKINLIGESNDVIDYSFGTISVYDFNGDIIDKFEINGSNYLNMADSIQDANNMIIYVQAYKTYTIHIDINASSMNSLDILITSLYEISVNSSSNYNDLSNVIIGDEILKLNIYQTGEYNLVAEYIDSIEEEIFFILIKENAQGLDVLDYKVLDSANLLDDNYLLDENDSIYIGYYNGRGLGKLSINLKRVVNNTFSIITDPNENVTVGSEVILNSGAYGGLYITQGFTRICYLGNDAPYLLSRTQYYWYSSDENVAKVSAYGTVTATALWTENVNYKIVTISAVYKNDTSIGVSRNLVCRS